MRRFILIAAFAGLVSITLYLIVERSIAAHLPLSVCLLQLLQWDASNAYGDAAFTGGWTIALAGLLMDSVVSLVWASVFAWLYVSVAAVRHRTILFGLLFGAVVMGVMIFLIVPLGRAHAALHAPAQLFNTLVAHTVFFGLPVALAIRYGARTALPTIGSSLTSSPKSTG